jgi:hypothetical protein
VASDFKVFPSFTLTAKDGSEVWQKVIGVQGNKPLVVTEAGIIPTESRWIKCAPVQAVDDQHLEIFLVTESKKAVTISWRLPRNRPSSCNWRGIFPWQEKPMPILLLSTCNEKAGRQPVAQGMNRLPSRLR